MYKEDLALSFHSSMFRISIQKGTNTHAQILSTINKKFSHRVPSVGFLLLSLPATTSKQAVAFSVSAEKR
jgi:hypothetical protein